MAVTPPACRERRRRLARQRKASWPARLENPSPAATLDKWWWTLGAPRPMGCRPTSTMGPNPSGAGIALFTPPGQQDRIGSFTGISFVADDVMATCRDLAKRGVRFVQEPKQADWGTSAIIADPDGNQFVVGSA